MNNQHLSPSKSTIVNGFNDNVYAALWACIGESRFTLAFIFPVAGLLSSNNVFNPFSDNSFAAMPPVIPEPTTIASYAFFFLLSYLT